jgi:PIN domain nuclease of toxin-antitoxin system
LDTQSLLWATSSPDRLSAKARAAISDPNNEILVSAASAWEIATKVRIGKLVLAKDLEEHFIQRIRGAGYLGRAVSVADGLRAGRLVGTHKDPFDRMIAAQALTDDIPVISNDEHLESFGVRRIW